MNPGDNYGQQQQPVIIPPQGQPQGTGAGNYQFSADELRVLRKCNSDSFWQRSLPFGTALGVGTFLAVQRGMIQPSLKFGPTPKVALACIVGYFLGKFSYQTKCAEMMMQLPNSRLAEALRKRKKGEFFDGITAGGALSMAPFSTPTDVYTDENLKEADPFKSEQNNSLDLDLSRPFNAGLDDTYRPSIDTPDRSFNDNLPSEIPKSTTTYEELRRQNRAEYDKKMSNPYYKPINEETTPVQRALPPVEDQLSTGPKNRYGDAWIK